MMVSCRKCGRCQKRWKSLWIGRTTLEIQDALSTWFVTLTYGGGDHEDAFVLNYSHVQNMFKKLRKDGFEFRYLVVGEYGGENHRAHWHLILFWQTPPPPIEKMDERVHWRYWQYGKNRPIGTVQVEKPRSLTGCTSYLMDYLEKQRDPENGTKFFEMRTSFQIGLAGLKRRADMYLEQGIPLFNECTHGPSFEIDGVLMADNKTRFKYFMSPSSTLCKAYTAYYIEQYEAKHGTTVLPYNATLNAVLLRLQKDKSFYHRYTMDDPRFELPRMEQDQSPMTLAAKYRCKTPGFSVAEYVQRDSGDHRFYLETDLEGKPWHGELQDAATARKALKRPLDVWERLVTDNERTQLNLLSLDRPLILEEWNADVGKIEVNDAGP